MTKLDNSLSESEFLGTERIGKILFRIAPPVMLAQLIQALYNIVDSFFVGKYSDNALTALTVIFPIQLVIIAFAVGTGVGVNTYMASKFAQDREEDAKKRCRNRNSACGNYMGSVCIDLCDFYASVCNGVR